MDDPLHGAYANAEFLGDFLDSLTLPARGLDLLLYVRRGSRPA